MDISTAKQIIKAATLADDAVIMQGVHGIGKSEVVKQFAKESVYTPIDSGMNKGEETGYHLEELFLSHQEVGDLIGIPHTIEMDGATVTTWSVPIWLQRMNYASSQGKRCVLFLDELNRAPIDVRQSALQLVLERKIHEHSLPESNDNHKTMVVAAINPADDYQVDELDPALLDRFLYIEVEPDAKSWLDWSRRANVNPIVRDFISEYPDRIHWTPADGAIGATPRSWTKLGDFMDKVTEIPEEILFQIMKGKVGTEIASQFYTFYKNYVDVVKADDIIKIVEDNKGDYDKIEDLAELITDKIVKTEAIQKSDLAQQLKAKFTTQDTMFPLLTYLYALEVEICVAFLKGFRKDSPTEFTELVKLDAELNDKNLFKRIVQSADKE